jgi:uncharacterized membrane protein YqiK
MNLSCDCKTITIVVILALILAILFGVLFYRINNEKDCGCDNKD